MSKSLLVAFLASSLTFAVCSSPMPEPTGPTIYIEQKELIFQDRAFQDVSELSKRLLIGHYDSYTLFLAPCGSLALLDLLQELLSHARSRSGNPAAIAVTGYLEYDRTTCANGSE